MQKRKDSSATHNARHEEAGYSNSYNSQDHNDKKEQSKRNKSFGELWSSFLLKLRIKRRYYFLLCVGILILFYVVTSEPFFDKVIYMSVVWIHRVENFYQDMPWHLIPFFSEYPRYSIDEKIETQSIVHRGSESYCTVSDEVPLMVNMRVPKTGGTTVTDLLRELSSANHFLLSYSSRLYPRSQEEIDSREKDMTSYLTSFQHKTAQSAHVRFLDFPKHGLPDPLYIGTFRDPLERMQSHYNYDSFSDRPLYVDYKLWVKGQVDVVKPSLTQCVRKFMEMKIYASDVPYGTDGHIPDEKIKELLLLIPKEYTCLRKKYINVQLKYYCGYHRHCKELQTSREMLQIAKNNLARFQVVMLTDKMHQSVHLLETMLPNYFAGASHIYENYEREVQQYESDVAEAMARSTGAQPRPYACTRQVMKGSKRRYCPCNGTLYYGRKYAPGNDAGVEGPPLSLKEMKASHSDFTTADVRKRGGLHCTHKQRAFQGGFARDPAPKVPKQCICEPVPPHDARKFKLEQVFHMRSNMNTNEDVRMEVLPYDVIEYLESFLSYEVSLYDDVKKHFQNNVERCGV